MGCSQEDALGPRLSSKKSCVPAASPRDSHLALNFCSVISGSSSLDTVIPMAYPFLGGDQK